MPVYIRHGDQHIPTPSISSVDIDDEDAFLLDPEMVVDELPQPYRMLNKVLDQLLDDTWLVISQRIQQREEEAKIKHPPVFQASSNLESFSRRSALCYTHDARYVFVAFQSGGLSAFDAVTHELIADWSDEEVNACFEQMTTAVIGQNFHLLSTIDDMGFARLFLFVSNSFHLIQLLNEQLEGAAKSNASKFDLTTNGDYCSIALECEEKPWLEVYKIPRDNWLREIEVAQKELLKRTQASSSDMALPANTAADDHSEGSDMLEIKFSSIVSVLKVKPPSPSTGNAYTTLSDAIDKAGLPGTIGTGCSHLLTNEHLNLRRSAITKLYQNELQNYQIDLDKTEIPTWHYLNSARMQSESITSTVTSDDLPVSICVWWKNFYSLQTYQLVPKPGKDLELKPDLVWPMSSNITCSAVSDCTNILALGLDNGFITVIDRSLCETRSTVLVGEESAVLSISILHGSGDRTNRPPVSCLIGLSNGSVKLLDCSTSACTTLVQSSTFSSFLIQTIPILPDVFLHSVEAGKTWLRNMKTGDAIGQLAVSESLEEPSSRIDFSFDGSILLVKNDDDSVQLFDFREITELEDYQTASVDDSPYRVKESMEARCQRFLSQRISQQVARTEHIESSWNAMAKELSILIGLTQVDSLLSKHSSSKKFPKWLKATKSIISHRQALSHQ